VKSGAPEEGDNLFEIINRGSRSKIDWPVRRRQDFSVNSAERPVF